MRLQSFLVNINRSKTTLNLASLSNPSKTRTLAQSSIPIISTLLCPFSSMQQFSTMTPLVNRSPSVLFLPIPNVNQEGLESVGFEQQQRKLMIRRVPSGLDYKSVVVVGSRGTPQGRARKRFDARLSNVISRRILMRFGGIFINDDSFNTTFLIQSSDRGKSGYV